MALARLKDWAYPARIEDIADVREYLEDHLLQHTEESISRIEDFENLEIDAITVSHITLDNTGLHMLDTDASHDLILKPGSNLTADRTLTLTTGNADRTFALGGNLTVEATSIINSDLSTDANWATTGSITGANFGVGVTAWGTSAVNVHGIGGSTAPTTSPADMIQTWSQDRGSGFAQLWYRAEGGTSRALEVRRNVMDYGAAGGNTDDTAAIQAAIDVANVGDTIFFTEMFKVTSTLTISVNRLTFEGIGPSSGINFYPTGGDNLFEGDETTDNVTFKKMTMYLVVLDATGATDGDTTLTVDSTTGLFGGMYVYGTDIPSDTTIVSVDSPTQITIDKSATGSSTPVTFTFKVQDTTCCEIVSVASPLEVATHYTWERVYFEGWTEYCINYSRAEYLQVKRCRFLNIGHTGGGLGVGIRTTTYANVVLIEGNRFSDCDQPVQLNTTGLSGSCDFVNNSIESSSTSADVTATSSVFFEKVSGLRVEGNYFEGNVTGSTTGVIRCDSCTAATIKANHFAGQDPSSNDKSYYFINAVSCLGTEISNNSFYEIITGFVIASGTTVYLQDNYYYDGGAQLTAYADIDAKLAGTYSLFPASHDGGTRDFGSINISTAGWVGTSEIKIDDDQIWDNSDNADGAITINYVGKDGGTTQFKNFAIDDGKGNRIATFVGSSAYLGLGLTTGIDSLLTIAAGQIFIGDPCASGNRTNTGMTTGLTINQEAAANEALAFKNNGVAHGCTDFAETDTYGLFLPDVGGGTLGCAFRGLGIGKRAFNLQGFYTTDDTAKTTAAVAPVMVDAHKISGTGITDQGADANAFVVRSYGSAKLIVDKDGDVWIDGIVDAFQDHDDIELLAELEVNLDKSKKLKSKDKYKKEDLGDLKILRPFLSMKRLNMLQMGAIRQLSERVGVLENA